MNKDKVINEFKLKINGVWYHSVLYETPSGKHYVERTRLDNGEVSKQSESSKGI